MMKKLVVIAAILFQLSSPASAESARPGTSSDNFAMTELTAAAKNNILSGLKNSVPAYADFRADNIPLDIRASMFVIEGLSTIAMIVYKNLLDVMIWLLVVFFAFWFGLEAWSVMETKTPIGDAAKKIVKKAAIISVAIFVLNTNPAEWFMMFLGAAAHVGNYAADLFLGAATGMGVAQTCGDTLAYVALHGGSFGFLGPENVANVICMTGRITEFFWTGLSESLALIKSGIGSNVAFSVMGVAGAALFLWCVVRFAILTLGVVVDMTLMLMFLPFAAFKESFKDGWPKDAGAAGAMIEKIANAFGGDDISGQIRKFVQVIIYVIAISIVASICYLLMKGVAQQNGNNFIYLALGGAVCAYMISQTEKIAEMMGGVVDREWAGEIRKNLESLATAAQKYGKNALSIAKKIIK
ncbi:MAG: hypothetical protein LBG89_00365 [Rickettsiales bacterium]|jgi:hypothetical protein|nr:hypothetical protein [Rickettsiales bacterium]